MRILVLDDDLSYLNVVEGMLTALGLIDCTILSDANHALEELSNRQFDLILLDINMRDFDGLVFLRILAEKKLSGVILLVSNEQFFLLNSAKIFGQKLGLNIFGALSKPLSMDSLSGILVQVEAKVLSSFKAEDIIDDNVALHPTIVFQPQINMSNGQVYGAEALVRGIKKNDGDLVGADQLLKRYQSTDERMALSGELLTLFCQNVKKARDHGYDNSFSFNLDAQMLEQRAFISQILHTVEAHDLSSHGIVLELTEAYLPKDQTRLIESIVRLSMAGFEVAMDDFSSGAASYETLRFGAFREVKLDMNLIQDSANNFASQRFVESVVDIADALDMRLVAEGVESKNDVKRLSAMGIKLMQGYYFSRPLDLDDFIAFMHVKKTGFSIAS